MNSTVLRSDKKMFLLLFLLVLVLAAAVFFGKNIPDYLAKASTCGVTNARSAQTSANSAVISWETSDVTQGRVEYGTSATNLAFSAPETASGKIHTVPLTLLTPNTVYYYLVTIGNVKCDASGQKCTDQCVPWSFTTAGVTPQKEVVVPLPSVTPLPSPQPNGGSPETASPTSGVSSFCRSVQINIGKNNQDATTWPRVSQYDMDANGIINGRDVVRCIQTGR